MPKIFKENLPNCRVIIDCTEVTITHSGDVEEEVLTYSDYKGRNTYKILIGIAPHGEVIFVSKAFGGRTTDSQIVNESGLLDLLESQDIVLADKGFPSISNNLSDTGATLIMPPNKTGSFQFTTLQNMYGYQTSTLRIHVE